MEPPSSDFISILNPSGQEIDLLTLRKGVFAALQKFSMSPADVTVLLTSDLEIAKLNHEYRGVSSATDVLTFMLDEDGSGDIAISLETGARQAAARGVALNTELAYLAIHGALHLAGLDDLTEIQRAEMMREMNDVAVSIGLPADTAWESIYDRESA